MHLRVYLAPMEGVVDPAMRAVLTAIGGYDRCVTEFLRVASTPLSARRLSALCPELRHGARTPSGTPVRIQLLGSDPVLMAESAALAADQGAEGIDLNFGCPAPTVNRHRGGAALLDEPELLHDIVSAVRTSVTAGLPVSAKMRLGIDDARRALECAQALAAGGAGEIVVHARTRADAYRAPARWEWIARIREALAIPVVANGDVWNVADWVACRKITGCEAVMIGRGALADPFLARRLRGDSCRDDWAALMPLLLQFWREIESTLAPDKQAGRLKQWLRLLGRRHPQAAVLFSEIRELRQPQLVGLALARHAERQQSGGGVAAAA